MQIQPQAKCRSGVVVMIKAKQLGIELMRAKQRASKAQIILPSQRIILELSYFYAINIIYQIETH
jgi:hypothetical protein